MGAGAHPALSGILNTRQRDQRFLEKWQIPGQEQEKQEISLDLLLGSESKEVLKDRRWNVAGYKSQPKRLPTSQIWDNRMPNEVMIAPDCITH